MLLSTPLVKITASFVVQPTTQMRSSAFAIQVQFRALEAKALSPPRRYVQSHARPEQPRHAAGQGATLTRRCPPTATQASRAAVAAVRDTVAVIAGGIIPAGSLVTTNSAGEAGEARSGDWTLGFLRGDAHWAGSSISWGPYEVLVHLRIPAVRLTF